MHSRQDDIMAEPVEPGTRPAYLLDAIAPPGGAPEATHAQLQAWIGAASAQGDESSQHLYGALELHDTAAEMDTRVETFQVFVQLKSFLKRRMILLHIYPTSRRRRGPCDAASASMRKEAGMIYFEAATGNLHGLHVTPEHRGRGLMKPLYVYYVLFCRAHGLETMSTAQNRKPLFAKLFAELGYQPRCTDFPFLLLRRAPSDVQEPPNDARAVKATADEEPLEPLSYVLPLAATNPRPKPPSARAAPDAHTLDELDRAALQVLGLPGPPGLLDELQRAWKARFTVAHPDKGGSAAQAQEVSTARDRLHHRLFPHEQLELDTSWSFSSHLAKSQGIAVVDAEVARLAEPGAIAGTSMLYAKTGWWLPDDDALARREAAIDELLGRSPPAMTPAPRAPATSQITPGRTIRCLRYMPAS